MLRPTIVDKDLKSCEHRTEMLAIEPHASVVKSFVLERMHEIFICGSNDNNNNNNDDESASLPLLLLLPPPSCSADPLTQSGHCRSDNSSCESEQIFARDTMNKDF